MSQTVTKQEIMRRISLRNKNILNKDAQDVVEVIFREMSDALSSGDRIEIRGFGTFVVKHREPRVARNPKTNETVQLAQRFVPYFRAGKELKDRLNESAS